MVFIELKNSNILVKNAYDINLKNYLKDIPYLFNYNQICVLSNGMETRLGSCAVGYEFFFGEVRQKIFNGFTKACHTLYKIDSNTERIFAIVLENDKDVQKWMRPSPKPFNIYYGPGGMSKYKPDFIVETRNKIYMVETKVSNEMDSTSVKEKAVAAVSYCNAVSEWNVANGGKPWEYALISHDEVRLNSSFMYLVSNRASYV